MKTYLLTFKNALYVPSISHNLIPPFIMRAAVLIVNDVPRIHTRSKDLINKTHCILTDGEEDDPKLKIPLKLDGILSYFETRKMTEDKIEQCEYIETVDLCTDHDKWDPYDPDFANREDIMVDFRGDVIVHEPKRRKFLESRNVFEINVSEERFESAISSIVAKNCCNPQDGDMPVDKCNPQDGDDDFNRDDDVYKAAISDISV